MTWDIFNPRSSNPWAGLSNCRDHFSSTLFLWRYLVTPSNQSRAGIITQLLYQHVSPMISQDLGNLGIILPYFHIFSQLGASNIFSQLGVAMLSSQVTIPGTPQQFRIQVRLHLEEPWQGTKVPWCVVVNHPGSSSGILTNTIATEKGLDSLCLMSCAIPSANHTS